MRAVLSLPFVIPVGGAMSLAMFLPMIRAIADRDWDIARSFLYGGVLSLIATCLIALALINRRPTHGARDQLLGLLGVYVLLPVVLAVPFHDAVGDTSFLNAYFEMVSSLTTTGATLFEPVDRLEPSLHLWRALVGWIGGLCAWVFALAILQPLSLGGFEVSSNQTREGARARAARGMPLGEPVERLLKVASWMLPIYVSLTVVLWGALMTAGESPFVGLCHAMATLSTSGVSPVGGLAQGQAGMAGEMLVALFLVLSLSRLTFSAPLPTRSGLRLREDPELRIALAVIITLPLLLFLRHWIAAYEVNDAADLTAALRALWGSVFTTLGFLSTSGFVSADWLTARNWSGLQTPGLILMGLALAGGGVATTAGGIKLLRIYALYRHSRRELDRLVHPSLVGGSGRIVRRIGPGGAQIAWVFFMLFGLSLAAIIMILGFLGTPFEQSVILSIAAVSNTGPLVDAAAEAPASFVGLSDPAKLLLSLAMVLGRLEALAILALFNPDFWRR